MIRQFRTISALMRHTWLIEPVYAEQHLPLLNSFLSGQFRVGGPSQTDADPDSKPEAPAGFILSAGHNRPAAVAAAAGSQTKLVRYELTNADGTPNTELPDNSVFVVDIRGAIFKESTCCAYGTETYARLINEAYANPKIAGIVGLIDSPGGQLSGTPTLFDAIRNPAKPFVSVVNEGMMASAAYWLACGSDFIYATQQTDMIGSIGVFVQFRDTSEAMAKMGIKTVTVYSSRSSEKNKPFRDALAGNMDLLTADLDQAADLFRAAVETGRGDRLKPATKDTDVFKGGLFYAGKAIEIGLIDGYGDLNTAVAKVLELAEARGTTTAESNTFASADPHDSSTQLNASATPALTGDNQLTGEPDQRFPAGTTTEPASTNSNPNQSPNDMKLFGFVQMAALAAIQGVAAADVTDEQIDALNAELTGAGYNVAAISQTQFAEVQKLQRQITTLTQERDSAVAKVAEYGSQAGVMPTKSEKPEEKTAGDEVTYISETDAELARLRGKA